MSSFLSYTRFRIAYLSTVVKGLMFYKNMIYNQIELEEFKVTYRVSLSCRVRMRLIADYSFILTLTFILVSLNA